MYLHNFTPKMPLFHPEIKNKVGINVIKASFTKVSNVLSLILRSQTNAGTTFTLIVEMMMVGGLLAS